MGDDFREFGSRGEVAVDGPHQLGHGPAQVVAGHVGVQVPPWPLDPVLVQTVRRREVESEPGPVGAAGRRSWAMRRARCVAFHGHATTGRGRPQRAPIRRRSFHKCPTDGMTSSFPCRVWSCRRKRPPFAGVKLPSMKHSSQRTFAWSFNCARKARHSSKRVPSSSYWRSRRQQVTGLPYSRGNAFHGAPVHQDPQDSVEAPATVCRRTTTAGARLATRQMGRDLRPLEVGSTSPGHRSPPCEGPRRHATTACEVSKTVVPARVPWVRIPPSPPVSQGVTSLARCSPLAVESATC